MMYLNRNTAINILGSCINLFRSFTDDRQALQKSAGENMLLDGSTERANIVIILIVT